MPGRLGISLCASLIAHAGAGLALLGWQPGAAPDLALRQGESGVESYIFAPGAPVAYEAPREVLVEIGVAAAEAVTEREDEAALRDALEALGRVRAEREDREEQLEAMLAQAKGSLEGAAAELAGARREVSVGPAIPRGAAAESGRPVANLNEPGAEAPAAGRAGASHGPTAHGANRPPVYPAAARRRGEAGTVMVHVLISAEGFVTGATVVRSSGFALLDDAAVSGTRAWKFAPAMVDGRPAACEATIPVQFVLGR